MSKITTVIDGILAALATKFPAPYSRIPNAYNLPDNIEGLLDKGYGLTIGEASFLPYTFTEFAVTRQISVIFTRESFKTESEVVLADDIAKQLLEDVYETQKLLFNPDLLGIPEIANVSIGSVSGIDEVYSGKRKYLKISASFAIDITEQF